MNERQSQDPDARAAGSQRDELRSRLHGMWSAVAEGWSEHADFIDDRGELVTERMLDLAAPAAGDHVLELACGPGGVGLAAAARVGAGGRVVLSDVAAEMTAIAARRAQAIGLDNVETRELDLDAIDQPDAEFDVVFCREGLMFATDHLGAAREIRRVLRPGGRFALAAWGPRERNPWLGILMDSVSAEFGAPIPPPGIPGPFALSEADRLTTVLGDAEFVDVSVTELEVPMRAASFGEWWTRTLALAGPLAKIVESQPADVVESIRARAREASAAYATADGFDFPGVTLLGSARRPG